MMDYSKRGLTEKEAGKQRLIFGKNILPEPAKTSTFKLLVLQFSNLFTAILLAAVIISLAVGDRLEAIFIALIISLNAVFGFWQEYKAEKALLTLKKMAGTTVRVIRGGREQEIDSQLLVPKDIIYLQEGTKVPADAEIVESFHLEVNESALSGESLPVVKHVSGRGDDNRLFMGTYIVRGRATAMVMAVGRETRFGKIAEKIRMIEDKPTPLTVRFEYLGKRLGIFAGIAAAMTFFAGIAAGTKPLEIFLTSISLAVAAVPEGLPAIVTVTLALGTQRMARNKAIVRKLSAIETLGRTAVICTDKTGTLTQNEMRVKSVLTEESELPELMRAGILCNSANLAWENQGKTMTILGDQTEGALLVFAHEKGLPVDEIKKRGSLLDEFSFDAGLKRMSVIWQEGKQTEVLAKGAPESILAICSEIKLNGQTTPLQAKQYEMLETSFRKLTQKGLRVIGLASKNLQGHLPKTRAEIEKNLIFLGFVGISDPPRPEVKTAINLCNAAAIKVVMVTGDNALTAIAVAREINLLQRGDLTIEGQELDALSDDELRQKFNHIRIFARTTPEHKLRIVQMYQNQGLVTAVTGDGINDALALKQADVGVAMGKTGTDVAREAADIVVTDDNFASIVTAIEEGRAIYDNIFMAIRYLVSCNVGEILTILGAIVIGLPSPLLAIQILWMNLVTDGLPALALALEKKSSMILRRSAGPYQESFFNPKTVVVVAVFATTMAFFSILLFIFASLRSLEFARTVVFNCMIIFQLAIAVFFAYSTHPFSRRPILWLSVVLTLFFQLILIALPPLRKIFHLGF